MVHLSRKLVSHQLGVLLPEDGEPSMEVLVDIGSDRGIAEAVITGMGQTEPTREEVSGSGGRVRVRLTHTPVYLFPEG